MGLTDFVKLKEALKAKMDSIMNLSPEVQMQRDTARVDAEKAAVDEALLKAINPSGPKMEGDTVEIGGMQRYINRKAELDAKKAQINAEMEQKFKKAEAELKAIQKAEEEAPKPSKPEYGS